MFRGERSVEVALAKVRYVRPSLAFYRRVRRTVVQEASIPRRLCTDLARERRVPTNYMTESNAQQLSNQFSRVFGHPPTPHELERYQQARARLAEHLPARAKRRAALLITRL